MQAIIHQCDHSESSPFAGISSEKLSSVRKKLDELYCSIEVNNFEAATNDGVTTGLGAESAPNAAVTALGGEVLTSLKDLKVRRAEAARLRKLGISAASVTFRKPSEQEIVALLRSFWSSIR